MDAVKLTAATAVLFVLAGTAFGQPKWKPKCNMDRQLFPALIIATATVRPEDEEDERDPQVLGDQYGLLGISMQSPARATDVKVSIRENALMVASSWSGKLEKSGERYFIAPKINYKFDQLRRVRQQGPLNVTFAVEVNGKPAGEQTETLNVRSINDCPWAVLEVEETIADTPPAAESRKRKQQTKQTSGEIARAVRAAKEETRVLGRVKILGPAAEAEAAEEEEEEETETDSDSDSEEDQWEDLGWMGAAFVNEGSPVIDDILKEALDQGWVRSFAGYQGDADAVLREVLAIWGALQQRGIRYSSVTATPGGSDRVHSQHIRFVDESLANKQANCADGSVLFCSILRKLGLRTFLTYIPGHMYMGVYLEPEGDDHIAIETTLLGTDETPSRIVKQLKSMHASLPKARRDRAEWKTFAAAVEAAMRDLRANQANFDADDNVNYQIIEIDEARQEGIMPIGYEKY